MFVFRGDEKKRSLLFNVVLAISSILILMVIAFFVMRSFTGNPLTGNWTDEEYGITLTIQDEGKAVIEVPVSEEDTRTINLMYVADPEEKTITFMNADTEYLKADSEDGTSDEMEDSALAEASSYISSFTYSVELNELILTENEFGDQIVLTADK